MSPAKPLYALVGVLLICVHLTSARRCNEVLCASVVSKCMLTQACKCEITRDHEKCSCCIDCAKCLGQYYLRCCSCLDMCDTESLDVDPNDSQVGDFSNPFNELFEAVTLAEEPLVESTVVSYPSELPLDELAKRLKKHDYKKKNSHWHNVLQPFPGIGINCTVVFMAQCHSAAKCREQCQSIGSGSYRYFFNGCCECVGATCLNYGINESRCPKCSNFEEEYYEFDYPADDGLMNEVGERKEFAN